MCYSLINQGKRYSLAVSVIFLLHLTGCATKFNFSFDFPAKPSAHARAESFVDISEVIPDIELEIRYFSDDNFIGQPIEGYGAAKALVTKPTAQALQNVQQQLRSFGLGLKIYDAYRPQTAVNHFIRWAKDLDDTRMKSRFYPDVVKSELFEKGYIAESSGHSRGSTVDLTIVSTEAGKVQDLDMGSGWDFFDPISRPTANSISASQRANRMLLQTVMLKNGFKPYDQEWWHFTLNDEPYCDIYFDFPVE